MAQKPPAPKADPVPPPVEASAAPAGPTAGELEEMREERDQALQQNGLLMSRMEEMMARLERYEKARTARAAEPEGDERRPGEDPVFDPTQGHGLVVGDSNIAYVQNGHQFASDRKYVATERDRGSPRAFNPRLVGVVRRPVVRDEA